MKILIVTPARRGSPRGNRVTAERWAGFCRQLGHSVSIAESYLNQSVQTLIALHAIKSAASIRRFRHHHPRSPIAVILTGTDLYRPIDTSKTGLASLDLADRLVLLQPDGYRYLPVKFHSKTDVIIQSAEPTRSGSKRKSIFEVVVIGHLRPVKDPFRTAWAAKRLPADSRIQVTHMGAALNNGTAARAKRLGQTIDRYRWLGVLPRWQVLHRLARSRLMVISSRSEGGAGVISESLASSVPILASRVSGNVGLLGTDYPGLFEYGSTEQLANLMYRAETDPDFYSQLCQACQLLKSRVAPERELRAIDRLIRTLAG
jgi:putative glycosyltransferase (TIGR04348 family)